MSPRGDSSFLLHIIQRLAGFLGKARALNSLVPASSGFLRSNVQFPAFPRENFQKNPVNLSKNPVNLSIFLGFHYSVRFFCAAPPYPTRNFAATGKCGKISPSAASRRVRAGPLRSHLPKSDSQHLAYGYVPAPHNVHSGTTSGMARPMSSCEKSQSLR